MTQKTLFTIQPTDVVRRNHDHVAAEIDGEVALMSIDGGNYYGLNAIGSTIWRLIEQERRVSDLCALLMREVDVEPQRCQTETLAYLTDLARHNLIEVIDA